MEEFDQHPDDDMSQYEDYRYEYLRPEVVRSVQAMKRMQAAIGMHG